MGRIKRLFFNPLRVIPRPALHWPSFLRPLRFLRFLRVLRVLVIPIGLMLVVVGGLGVALMLYGMDILVTAGVDIPEVTYTVQAMLLMPLEWLIASSVVLAIGVVVMHRALLRFVLSTIRSVIATPGAIWRAPMRAYRRAASIRDWIMAKVEYLQAESAKWKLAFNMLKSPYLALRWAGLSPQAAVTLLAAGSVATTGVVVNETILEGRSFERGDPGIYLAPGDAPVAYIDDPDLPGYNTLRIDLGTTPVRSITIENVSVGTVFTGSALPSGEQNVVQVGGSVVTGGTNTRLEVGHLIFEKSRCKKLTLSDIQAHTLIVRGNASDGQSIAPSPGTSRMLAIGGGHHQADAMLHSGGLFDRILIQAPTSAVNGKIDKLTLSNLFTKGGECVLSRITAGTIEILYNEVGQGNGFATKEFVISTNVTGAVITVEDNVEVSISEPATS